VQGCRAAGECAVEGGEDDGGQGGYFWLLVKGWRGLNWVVDWAVREEVCLFERAKVCGDGCLERGDLPIVADGS